MSSSGQPILPVILCGGSGTRLWPLSRRAMPKQFLSLQGPGSLLQQTAKRFGGPGFAPAWYLCAEEHRFMVAAQVQEAGLPHGRIILEPAARGTAPAACLAALAALAELGGDPMLLVSPADHVVQQPAALLAAVAAAASAARDGALMVFGIVPSGPETAYGYIQAGADPGHGVRKVAQFTEKPDAGRAAAFLAAGNYFWNSGIFLFSARHFIAELERHRPDIVAACRKALLGWRGDLDFHRIDAEAFAACPADAIDTAVMERTHHAAMLPLDAGWSDVGTWSSLWEIAEADADGNVRSGPVSDIGTMDSYLRSDGPLLTAIGVSNLLVVATEDAVLVAPRDKAQDLRLLVEKLKAEGRIELEQSRRMHRPWGHFRLIDAGRGFQVKQITVNPGASLSLQLHHQRAEHWVVVNGTARITRGDEVFTLVENQSTYIPVGVKHRLENPTDAPLLLIEVQSGVYLGEDDIVRFEDKFGRN